MKIKISAFVYIIALLIVSCSSNNNKEDIDMADVKLMTLDPGHFHAALVQKSMYSNVSPEVFVYAPEGPDLIGHLARIEGFNTRPDQATNWKETVYTGSDFFEKMIEEKPGNVVVLSGNNAKKTEYIYKAIETGLNILADKPMAINSDNFLLLEKAFELAREKGVLLYDVMTERHEINTMLQKALSQMPELFGELIKGSPEEPAVTKESVHHFFKYVSGSALKRPAWFFDTKQQGEGIVDVTTHLVDLVQWECYPEAFLKKSDIEIVSARRWPTIMNPEEFNRVTALDAYPDYLLPHVVDGNLNVFANGALVYKIKDTYAKVVVEWKYQAPEGTGDTHYSIMRGTKCDLIIQQGEKESYKPTLYVQSHGDDLTEVLPASLANLLWESLSSEDLGEGLWKLNVPDKYKVGHEAHFGQVTEKYLEYLKEGKLPDWEVPNMIVKYYTTTEALKMAMKK
ncbi:MAG: putative oxidoreductase C-terminal domain-containing protein [Bacteroidales bacterium]|nr:putative oxidoreductase C-terminal domain-containing protein [Bacteroidales bacterium]